MGIFKNTVKFFSWLMLSMMAGAGLLISAIYLYLSPTLPDIQSIREVDLQTPLRIYSADGKLMSEFGEKRRTPIAVDDTPQLFIDALLASEDDGFYEHGGIDYKGLSRAVFDLITTGRKKSGGSTITMQVAKNYYLSSTKTFTRKFTEILLALKLEKFLTKNEILELYINKIYLGKRAYGIEAASQVYYGRSINELSLAQLAMIAGLPQAPSAANPLRNPARAIKRRNYVLNRMVKLQKISEEDYNQALAEPVTATYHGIAVEMEASYIAEMVRQEMVKRYGDNAYTAGYSVHTTISSERQRAANVAVQRGLLKYDRDHGLRQQADVLDIVYRAALPDQAELLSDNDPALIATDDPEFGSTDITLNAAADGVLAGNETPADATDNPVIDWPETLNVWDQFLRKQNRYGIVSAAVVRSIVDDKAVLHTSSGNVVLPFSGVNWAAPYINVNRVGEKPAQISDVLSVGQPIWIEKISTGWRLAQLPEAESALVSIDPNTGALQSLVGGFAFSYNKYNRAVQATRQPGSSFKPFIYSAALANGYTPASIINDAPVVFNDARLESTWRPENHGGKFYGPTRLRQALYKSQNLVSIRVLKDIGPRAAIRYIEPFGFADTELNSDLSLALGASAVTPLQLATAYCALANGGYAVQPYFIDRIEDRDGQLLEQFEPAEKVQVMNEQTNFLTVNMMQDVIKRGTGKRALSLGRSDLAGKTGTTNDQKDAWFAGFSPDLVTAVWVGFDKPSSLGRWAFGGTVALPIWIDYMKEALADQPQGFFKQPEGIASVRIDPKTGLLAYPGQTDAIFEYFREENIPTEYANRPQMFPIERGRSIAEDNAAVPEQLF